MPEKPRIRLAVVLRAHGGSALASGVTVDKALPGLFARSVLDCLQAGIPRLAIHFPGTLLESMNRSAPRELSLLREQVREGALEVLAAPFHGMSPPLWPKEFASASLAHYQELAYGALGIRPRGFLPSGMVWEPAMAGLLRDSGLDYCLLPEEALGPGSWCRVAEDCGKAVHVLRVSTRASNRLFGDDPAGAAVLLASAGEEQTSVLLLPLDRPDGTHLDPPLSVRLAGLISRLGSEASEVVWRTPAAALDSWEGAPRFFLPQFADPSHGGERGVRALVTTHPAGNLMHKRILGILSTASALKDAHGRRAVEASLLPAAADSFFCSEGLRDSLERARCQALYLRAERLLDDLAGEPSSEISVADHLGNGDRQILARDSQMVLLVEHRRGGVVRCLEHRTARKSVLHGPESDANHPGAGAWGARDSLYGFTSTETDDATLLEAAQHGGALLLSPYEYQLQRQEDRTQILLVGEQGASISGKQHSFRSEKVFSFPSESAELLVSLALTNATFQYFKGCYCSSWDITLAGDGSARQSITVGKERHDPWAGPVVRRDTKSLEIRDRGLGIRVLFEFRKPCILVCRPATDESGKPQHLHLSAFWDLDAKGQETLQYPMRVRVRRYRGILP